MGITRSQEFFEKVETLQNARGRVLDRGGEGRRRRLTGETARRGAAGLRAGRHPTVAPPRRYDVEALPNDLRETTKAYVAIDALREAVEGFHAGCRKDAAAAAWHAEPVVRFICSTFAEGVADVGVSEDGFIMITAEFSGEEPVEARIAVGQEGTYAGKINAGEAHAAATAPAAPSFEHVLKERFCHSPTKHGKTNGGKGH